MKKFASIIISAIAALIALTLASCGNPFMVHNLERPVYLTGIEVRSDALTGDDPSHPLDQVFKNDQTSYTITVPYNALQISINGVPEEGAEVSGEMVREFDGQETSFSFMVSKEHRLSTTYTIRVLRGLPEAVLAGLELYVGDQADPDNLEDYEQDNYIVNFVPARGSYEIKVPAYTHNLALIASSYTNEDNKVTAISYEFKAKNGETLVTIGADGRTEDPEYRNEKAAARYFKAPLPSWYPVPELWGDIQVFPGGDPVFNNHQGTWFGIGNVDPGDPDPFGPGKVASIVINAWSENLSVKKYVLELQREEGAAYLEGITVLGITGAAPDTSSSAKAGIKTDGITGTAETGTNRLVGSFARTNLRYDAALPKDANAVRITPKPDKHLTSVTYTYTTYYYDADGVRYYINDNYPLGPHNEHPVQFGDPPPDDQEPAKFPGELGGIDLYFNATGDLFFQDFIRMELVITVKAASGPYVDKTYRLMIRRQNDAAVLNGIGIYPYEPDKPLPHPDGNVFTGFSPKTASYTVNVEAGRTHARVSLDNDGGPAPGTANRKITVSTPSQSFSFHKEGTNWLDQYNNNLGAVPSADLELKSRNTMVQVRITDNPGFSPGEYIINILSKNSNDIIITPDEPDYRGDGRAVFADGPNAGLTAEHALPGDLIELTIEANLGYFINFETNPYPVPGGVDAGVSVSASTRSMGAGGYDKVRLVSNPNDWKVRKYQFTMPDENVIFQVDYRPTVTAVNGIAYVAPPGLAKRGGGYKSGPDKMTATSWGTASYDLQAVINSWEGPGDIYEPEDSKRFAAIYMLRGTYYPPDPSDYTEEIENNDYSIDGKSNDCFGQGESFGKYHVTGYQLVNINGKEDIAFVLRPGIKIYGGFEETDNDADMRSGNVAQKTVLSGGSRASHVVLAVGAGGVILNGLTIEGGNAEGGGTITVTPPDPNSTDGITPDPEPNHTDSPAREHGGGIYVFNSNLRLENVIIRRSKAVQGGGMYLTAKASGNNPSLTNVEFVSNIALKYGGGMYSSSSNPYIEGSLFRDNKSSDLGGGLYVSGGTLNVLDTRFLSNSAVDGGGLFISGGSSYLFDVTVSDSWTSGSGSGIFNASEGRFHNLTVYKNVSSAGSGIGIYNSGSLWLTNTTLAQNDILQGTIANGGGLYNAGKATLSNVTIRNNSANSGGGIYNTGSLLLANCIVNYNEATGSGGALYNRYTKGSASASDWDHADAILGNTTLAGNKAARGGGIYNEYEGSEQQNILVYGSLNVLLQNVRITGNEGGGIYNRYFRFSGRGINLTLNNTTVADNLGIGIYTKKDNSNDGAVYPYDNQATEADPDKPAQKAFPVYIRFRNSVVYGNTPPSLSTTISGTASVWDWTGYPSLSVQLPPVGREGRETYEYSLLEGMDLSAAGTGNLDGTTVSPGFVSPLGSSRGTGGDYRPAAGSALIDPSPNGADLYPASGSDVLGQLFWKLDTNNGGLLNVFIQPLLYTAISNPVHLDLREYFLQYDNSFNTGDLRYDWVDDDLDKNGNWLTANLRDNWLEGPKSKTRPGLLDIGAYEQ